MVLRGEQYLMKLFFKLFANHNYYVDTNFHNIPCSEAIHMIAGDYKQGVLEDKFVLLTYHDALTNE